MEIKYLQQSPDKLKKFFFLSFLLLVIILVLNFLVLPYFCNADTPSIKKIVVDFFNNFTAVLVSGMASVLFLLFVTPKVLNESEIIIVNPYDLKKYLEKMMEDTSRYIYYGHTARWNRTVTIPRLSKDAEKEHKRKEVDLIILDPSNKKSIMYYSKLSHAKREKGMKIKSPKDVMIELYITILIMLKIQKENHINIDIYLSKHISLFRFDMSENSIIMTKPYSNEPALLFNKGTFFYKSYVEEIHIAKDRSKKLSLKSFVEYDINKENCVPILNKMNFPTKNISYEDVDLIINGINESKKPY